MAPVPAQRVPDDMAGNNRDVADLWKDALKTYKGIVGFDLERKFENVKAMITRGTKEMQNFHKFRHDDKKVDKLRGLFSANLDYIEKGAQQLVAAAVPTFPPAAAIGTAVTFMLSVSADYDIVMVFFEDMNSFLQRIVILETRLPKYNAYQNCLMDVFMSFLTMCGFAHKYIEVGRFKNWISHLIQGEDSELGGARKKMDLRIQRLQEATKFAILGNTEEIQKMTLDGEHKGKPSAAEHGKHPSAKGIRNTLMEVEGEDHEYHVLQETIVPDTRAWAFREPQWNRWLNQEAPPNTVLAITGSQSTGKNYLAFSVYQALKSEEAVNDSSRRTCVAQFYFREQDESLSSFTNGLISVINQVAEQNPELCEAMYAEIVRDESQIDRGNSDDLLRKLLGAAFGQVSKGRLFLVFDGTDEIADNDLALFEQFIKTIEESALRISMAYTARSDFNVQEASSNPPLNIEIAREKQMDDLRTIIWARINSLSALKKFSRYVFQPSSLARLNTLEREGAVLRSLEKPLPRTLDQLYKVTTAECFRRTESDRRLSLLRFWSNQSDIDLEEIPEPFDKLLQIGDPDSGAETRAKIQSHGKLPIKLRERFMLGFFREEPVAPNDDHRPRRSEAHRQMIRTCCNFIQPEHPSIMSTDQGAREYAINYVLHHWRGVEADHLNVEQQTEVMETFASLMLDKSSFGRIQEQELKTTFYHDEIFVDSFFDRLRSWAGLFPDVKVSLSTEAAEWWALIAERPRDCLVQLAKSHVRRLQDAVDMNTAEASFLAANGALRICGKGAILEEQARESFASAVGNMSRTLSAKQAVLGLDVLFGDINLGSTGYHWLAALHFLYKQVQPAESTCLKAMNYSQTPLEHKGRQIDPSNLVTGDALRAQIKLFENEPYLVYQAVIRAAVESGEVAFVVQMYQDLIRLLENVNASAPLLIELGFPHINATKDLEAARTVFDQALDSGSTGWPYAVTGEAPEATLDTANTFQSEVLYRLFPESADVKRKRKLLEVEGLLMRPLALDVPPISNTAMLYRQIVLARMYLKLGPAEMFHQTLQGVVDSCVGALSDNVGWNDGDNLVCLAMSLGILGGTVKDGQGLKRAAQILLEERGDEDSDDVEDSATKGDESDLDEDTELFCDGGCIPTAKFKTWAGSVCYLCLVCSECFLCKDCYKMRGRDDHHSLSRPRYMPQCPPDHEYIEVPIKGSRGVVDGTILLEGEEPVAFRDYLQQIREELCKEAWESF
ncbi:hypothetical protein GCG54_00015042 [Colletotrichum gloeosporioides]|uniref:Fungal STAND N-terminal Goodbye domain-containing protein n=1 Tax=Colletotrichum gloeosporioides TaxID=474922 RepID=A0A8H4CDS8_COLGL|nr:uncharacterized protein GCG54_00015042 [Colletotrichum gloeosporioides]KAF3801822.1 hypothetical protein GCG54_00015042 [Colletotrichum gloeosporioides]